MKNMKKYFGLILAALFFSVSFMACTEEDEFGSANVGLGIKVFSPNKVVAGQPVIINGSGFGEVTEIVFPGDIKVTNFELVTNEMIRVITPAGVNIPDDAESAKLIVRTADDEAESPLDMTLGNTQVTAFSEEEGVDVKAKSVIKVFGKDMEFVSKAFFINDEDEMVELGTKDFTRIATNVVYIKVPSNVKEGKQVATIETLDGKKFNLPEYNYVAAAGGHWEVTKTMIWENADPAGNGPASWNGTYRFSNTDSSTGEEIYAIPMDQWDLIKNGEFIFEFAGSESSNVRITTGWWSGAYGGDEHNSIDFAEPAATAGNYIIKMNIKEDGNLYDNIDAQHLLFTGSDYTPMAIYTESQVWVEDAEGHWERKSLWKNDGSAGDINWNGTYRFSNVETSTGEEIYAFPMEDWELLKSGVVRAAVTADDGSNIRITTGWWSGAYGGDEHNSIDFIEEESDGTKYIQLDFPTDGNLIDNLDAQHLLFTGSGYSLDELYVLTWVEEGAAKTVVVWENADPSGNGPASWNGTYRFSNEESATGEEIYAIPMDQWSVIKEGTFFLEFAGSDASNLRITTGWWSGAYGGDEHNSIDFAEPAATDGNYVIKLNLKEDGNLYDNVDAQHLLFTGSDYTPMKIYYVE